MDEHFPMVVETLVRFCVPCARLCKPYHRLLTVLLLQVLLLFSCLNALALLVLLLLLTLLTGGSEP